MPSALALALPTLAMYLFVQGITPGPANLCSMATALRLGVRPALRQWVGLTLGFYLVMLAVVAALWGAADLVNNLLPLLTVLGSAYVLWLAWSMVRPVGGAGGEGDGVDCASASGCAGHGGFAGVRPTIGAGVVLQVTNVKILVMATSALVAYVVPYTSDPWILLAVAMAIPVVGATCNLAWIYGGVKLQSWYAAHQRAVDAAMAAALALCALGMLAGLLG